MSTQVTSPTPDGPPGIPTTGTAADGSLAPAPSVTSDSGSTAGAGHTPSPTAEFAHGATASIGR